MARSGARPPRSRRPRSAAERSRDRRRPSQPPAAGRQPHGSPGSGGASFGAAGYGAFAGEEQFGGAYRGRSADTAGPHRGASVHEGVASRQPREPYIAREAPGARSRERHGPGGESYGGYGSTGDYGYGARGEYGESQTGFKLPYGQEQSGRGDYTGYGTYGGANEPALARAPRVRGPMGYVRPDERIREDVCESLGHLPGIDFGTLRIEVRDGRVLLNGTVRERRMRYAIEDVAAHCSGVRDVENRIRVQLIDQQRRE
jgi:hypothetical protein